MGGLLVLWGSVTSSSSSATAGREEDGVRLKEALGATGSPMGRTTGAGVGVELVDQDTDALPPPCFITSLVGGKGAGADAGVGADAGIGAEAAAGGVGAGARAIAAAGVGVAATGGVPTAGGAVLTELSSTFMGLTTPLSSKQELATNSSAKREKDYCTYIFFYTAYIFVYTK